MTSLAERVGLVIGVDTHKHTHTAAVVDATTGGMFAELTVPTDTGGYSELLTWVAAVGPGPRVWALEGGGGYGAGLARFLGAAGEQVAELDRPKRSARRHGAKSDSLDAVRAAREALGREHLAEMKHDGPRAELAALMTARRSAVEAAATTQRQMHALVIAAPEDLRTLLRASTTAMTRTAARLRCRPGWDRQTTTTATVLRAMARRTLALQAEAHGHELAIGEVVRAWRPDLLEQPGIGVIVAAQVLICWSHPGRIRSEAAFAMLAGTAPIPASSGMTTRHRLNRSGDRQLNRAMHVIALSRSRYDQRTRDYIDRRRAQGKTDREIRRCLKRYITRDLFRQLEHGPRPA